MTSKASLTERLERALGPAQLVAAIVVVGLSVLVGALVPPVSLPEGSIELMYEPSLAGAIIAPDDARWIVEDSFGSRLSLAIVAIVLELPRPLRLALPGFALALVLATAGVLLAIPRMRRAPLRTRAVACAGTVAAGGFLVLIAFAPGGLSCAWLMPAAALAFLLAISYAIAFATMLLAQRRQPLVAQRSTTHDDGSGH
jgi:hypothetical protein